MLGVIWHLVSGQRSLEFKAGNALQAGNVFDAAMHIRLIALWRNDDDYDYQ